jgi:hypothetical protein
LAIGKQFKPVPHTPIWGVCTKVDSARAGMLTWEHQTGKDCFEQ